jgi:hypothetical protein
MFDDSDLDNSILRLQFAYVWNTASGKSEMAVKKPDPLLALALGACISGR